MTNTVVYDDTTANAAGSDAIGNDTGFSFTTSGTGSGSLVDVKLELKDASASADGGYIAVTLYNNAAGMNEPGAQIASLGTINDSQLNANGSGTLIDIPLAASATLAPGSRYWIELADVGGSNATLNFESDNSGTGVSGEFGLQKGTVYPNVDGAYIGEVTEETVACYVTGTLIRTVRGDIPVEHLAIGDLVVTAGGAKRPIVWLGSRTLDCRRHPCPADVMPVRIAAGTFGEGRPARNLWLSPGHSVCLDILGEVLIPASALVDGAAITQVAVDAVTYWHVELDSHDIILAENLPAESYLEMGNRQFFAEAGTVALHASPDAKVPTHADFCRPFVAEGPLVEAVKALLGVRAGKLADMRCKGAAAA